MRLGVLVDPRPHHVVVEFTNASAIIIAAWVLDKLFGVGRVSGEHHDETGRNVIVAAFDPVH